MIKKRLDRKEDEKFWLISGILILPLIIGSSVYLIYLRSVNVIESDTNLVLYGFSIGLASILIGFGIHEALYSHKVKGSVTFYLKRFLVRTFVLVIYWASIMTLWFTLNYLLLPYTSWKYNLLLSLFIASLMLSVIVRVPKIKDFLGKIENDDYSYDN